MNQIEQIKKTFSQNIESVFELMQFDEIIQSTALNAVKTIRDILHTYKIQDTAPKITTLNNQLTSLEKIKTNDSLAPKYQKMFNQCVVLLVSYFASAVEDLFVACLSEKDFKKALSDKDKDIKITLGGLLEPDFSLTPECIAQL